MSIAPGLEACLAKCTFHRTNGNIYSLEACLEACREACLILAKCLFFAPLSVASMAISIASRPAPTCFEACLAKCTFHRISGNFHSLEACLEACREACLILAKCLFFAAISIALQAISIAPRPGLKRVSGPTVCM